MAGMHNTGTAPLDLRTSDDDRDTVVGLLNEAYAAGRLQPAEFDARLDEAMRARTYRDLYRVLDGLPVDGRRLPGPPRQGRRAWAVAAAMGMIMLLLGVGAAATRPGGAASDSAAGSGSPAPPPTAQTPAPSPSVGPTEDAAVPGEQEFDDVSQRPDAAVEPVTRSGSGTSIVTVPWVAGVTPMIEFEVDRPRFTTFTLSDGAGVPFFTYVDAGLSGGPTSGATVMPDYAVPTGDTLRLKVQTEGPWTLTLRDIDDAPRLQQSGSGTGYGVFWYDGPEAVFGFDAGEGLYSVDSDYALSLNGVGPGRDEGVLPAGPRLVRIEAAAGWRYDIR